MNQNLYKAVLAFYVVFSAAVPTNAAAKSTTPPYVGYDVSYPQCSKTLPVKPAFGVVGVNDGLANTTNPCLTKQLTWAANSTGLSSQSKVQLYVNTANPGGLNTSSWPTDNTDPSGASVHGIYGDCDGSNSLACSWQYGWNRAYEDAQQRFPDAAATAGINPSASAYTWWLDVETINTWQTGSSDSTQKNSADLEGMTAYLQSIGANVGLYSTTSQWGQIAGSTSSSSNLAGLNNWRPGARSLSSAKSNCSLPPLTTGGLVTLTQYLASNQDYDYSCQ